MKNVKIFKAFEVFIDNEAVEILDEFLQQENKYDEKGNLLKEIMYDEEGNKLSERDCVYNENSKLIKETKTEEGNLSTVSEFVYNEDILLEEKHFFDGFFQEHIINIFDEKGILSLIESRDEDGKLDMQKKMVYNERGLLTCINIEEIDGDKYKEIEHEYNNDGLITKTIYHTMEGKELLTEMFYDNKNLIKTIAYNEFGGFDEIDENEYDEKHRVIKNIHKTPDSIFTTEYEYDAEDRIIHSKVIDRENKLVMENNRKYENSFLSENITIRYIPEFNRKTIETERVEFE